MTESNTRLIEHLKLDGVLRSELVEAALRQVDRARFVPADMLQAAYLDSALPIGHGQTISQPYTVVFMLERLAAKAGHQVMDIGAGSGWQSCLLAHLVGPNGRVYALELIDDLCRMARENIARYPDLAKRIVFYCQNAANGLAEAAKRIGGFDRIIAAAHVSSVPAAWRQQLKKGGIMVYPMAGSIFKEIKQAEGKFQVEEFPGFVFVPFVSNE